MILITSEWSYVTTKYSQMTTEWFNMTGFVQYINEGFDSMSTFKPVL